MASEPTSSASPNLAQDIKTHSSPAAFSTILSLLNFPFSLYLPAPPRASGRAELYLLPAGLTGPGRTDTTRPVRKYRSATADSHLLDVLAALSRRPFDP